MEQAQKDSLKVQALTQSLAQKVAMYEEQLADFRAEASIVIDTLNAQIADLRSQLEAKDEDSSEEGPSADDSE